MSGADIRQRLFSGEAEVTCSHWTPGGAGSRCRTSPPLSDVPGDGAGPEVRGDLELMDFMLTEDKGDRILAIDCIDLVDPDYVGGNGRTLGGISRRLKKYAL